MLPSVGPCEVWGLASSKQEFALLIVLSHQVVAFLGFCSTAFQGAGCARGVNAASGFELVPGRHYSSAQAK